MEGVKGGQNFGTITKMERPGKERNRWEGDKKIQSSNRGAKIRGLGHICGIELRYQSTPLESALMQA